MKTTTTEKIRLIVWGFNLVCLGMIVAFLISTHNLKSSFGLIKKSVPVSTPIKNREIGCGETIPESAMVEIIKEHNPPDYAYGSSDSYQTNLADGWQLMQTVGREKFKAVENGKKKIRYHLVSIMRKNDIEPLQFDYTNPKNIIFYEKISGEIKQKECVP